MNELSQHHAALCIAALSIYLVGDLDQSVDLLLWSGPDIDAGHVLPI